MNAEIAALFPVPDLGSLEPKNFQFEHHLGPEVKLNFRTKFLIATLYISAIIRNVVLYRNGISVTTIKYVKPSRNTVRVRSTA